MKGDIVQQENAALVARREFRSFKNVPTFGLCPGYLQANIAIIPSHMADKFLEFCHLNAGPCPLLYKSQVGEVEIPLFAKDSDIRTDLPEYKVFKDGVLIDTVDTLANYCWDDLVTFYLGCSFSFDQKLTECGIKLKNFGKIVSMYVSNIDCVSVPPFSAKMVVSMRPILKSQLHLAVNATINQDYCHGAPIHIGCPVDIGVYDYNDGLGSPIELSEDEVPVFWPCGVTSQIAVRQAKLPLSFSHSPGKMFIADMKSDDVPNHVPVKTYPKAKVVCLDEKLQRYSIVSEKVYTSLGTIEKITSEDLGNRGISQLLIAEDFHKACLSLSKNCHSVAIILGFPLFESKSPSEENDGIAGAIYLANALLNTGSLVTFFIDSFSGILKDFLISSTFLTKNVTVLSVGKDFTENDLSFLVDKETGKPFYTHIVAIERPSTSIIGGYRTMSGRSISCEPLDIFFQQGNKHPDVITIGIGDGGNEVGMGKVCEKVISTVPHGNEIATRVSCDYLVTCGVSNWGGLALAVGLYALRQCPVHKRFCQNGIAQQNDCVSKEAFIPNEEKDETLHRSIAKWGFRDGITGNSVLTVDGLDYFQVHLEILKRYQQVLSEI